MNILKLLPAPAGMILRIRWRSAEFFASPRTRGDDPRPRPSASQTPSFSPHPRG